MGNSRLSQKAKKLPQNRRRYCTVIYLKIATSMQANSKAAASAAMIQPEEQYFRQAGGIAGATTRSVDGCGWNGALPMFLESEHLRASSQTNILLPRLLPNCKGRAELHTSALTQYGCCSRNENRAPSWKQRRESCRGAYDGARACIRKKWLQTVL